MRGSWKKPFECTLVVIKSHLFVQPSALPLSCFKQTDISLSVLIGLYSFIYYLLLQCFCRNPCVQTRLSIRSQMFIRPRVVVTSDPPRISPDVGIQKSKNLKVRKCKKCKDNNEWVFEF